MIKYICPEDGCDHEREAKGFCPDHGAQLVKEDDTSGDKGADDLSIDNLLTRVGETVEERLKEYGFDNKANDARKIQPGDGAGQGKIAKFLPFREKMEYAKGLLNEKDKAHFEALSDDKERDEFLKMAVVGKFFQHAVGFKASGDPEHLAHVKALAEGTDAVGGYLVPQIAHAIFVRNLKEEGFLRNWVRVFPVSSDSGDMPTESSSVRTSWGSENTSITTTTARFGQLTYSVNRLDSLLYTSRELVADSIISVVPLITQLFREAIGREEDRVIVNGSGSGQPKGILQETLGGIDNANVDADLPDNIRKLPYELPKPYRRNARWLVNGQSLAHISALKDGDNRYLFNPRSGGIVEKDGNTLAGYPLEEQGDMPLDTLLLGDFSQYFLFDRESVSIETTTEGAGTFEKHQVAIKVVERLDGKVAQTNGFVTITNAGID